MEAPAPTHRRDPFATTSDPAAYVPRTATEAALVRLEMALVGGADLVTLRGPHGAGKTMLLHILADRLDGEFRALYAPYPKLPPSEFCQWTLAALGVPPADDPEQAFTARLEEDASQGLLPLLLMIDDANLLPTETMKCMRRAQMRCDSHLRLVLARSGGLAGRAFESHSLPSEDVWLDGQMDSRETARYVRTRLDRVGADGPARKRLEGALPQLHAAADGIPLRLHTAAAEMLFRLPSPPDSVGYSRASKQRLP